MGDAAWPAIIDEATWLRVQELLDAQATGEGTAPKQTYLLSGIARCGKCGGTTRVNKAPNGADHRIYVCAGIPWEPEKGNEHTSIPVDFADGLIVRRLIEQMERTGRVSFHPQPTGIDVTPLKKREQEIGDLMAELVADRTAGLIDRAALLAGTAGLREELAGIQAEIAKAGS